MVAKSDTTKSSPTSKSPKGGESQEAKAGTSPGADQLGSMMNTIATVEWGGSSPGGPISGLLTVAEALNATYTAFIVGGCMFQIPGSAPGGRRFGFTYSGTMSPAAITSLVRPGAQIFFRN
jgi:hypothetical protein